MVILFLAAATILSSVTINNYHQPVLLREVLSILNPQKGQYFLDATLGNGGHTLELLKTGAIVYALEQDPSNLVIATERISSLGLSQNFFPIHQNFSKLDSVVKSINHPLNGFLFDLGLSSNQQKASARGFSFEDNLSLDMRLDPQSQSLTAEEIINTYSFDQLYDIFTKIGQEKLAKPIIIRIIEERQQSPLKSGERLANIIRQYYQQKHIKTSRDPATKMFMSLRIVVNDEFNNLKNALNTTLLSPLSTVTVISFHSGEDRIVKQFIRQKSQAHLIEAPSRPILPSSEEIFQNPLSRSAVLRSYKIV